MVNKMYVHHKSGFTLIELMITLVIASFLFSVLNNILQQSARSRLFVEARVKDTFFIGTLAQALTQDFSGVTIWYPVLSQDEKEKQEKVVPPVQITRGIDNTIQELRFFSVNAREYATQHFPTEVVYNLTLSSTIKKTYTLTRKMKHSEQSKKSDFDIPPVVFLDNIVQCTVQFVKQKSNDEVTGQEDLPFELFDEWPAKKLKQEAKTSELLENDTKNDSQKTEFETITYVRITMSYIKNERGVVEAITLLIPIFFNKQFEIKENQEKTSEKNEQKKENHKKIEDQNREELVLLEERTSSMLKLILRK